METEIDDLMRRLVRLEGEIEARLDEQRAALKYKVERHRAVFEDGVVRRHRQMKTGMLTFLRRSPLAVLLVSPAVYGVIVPLAILDAGVGLLQTVCFRAWGIPRVRRADYVILDRHRLAYLNGIEKLNCLYCGYANGVIAYAAEVASRTEQFWCPIKHALRARGAHRRYPRFVDYGDADGYRARLDELRAEIRRAPGTKTPS